MYVQSLFVYPIKSGAGIEVEALRLLPHGPQYDRIFVVVDEAGQPLTQIGHPQLCLISTAITAEAFVVRIPTVGEFSLPLERHEGSVRDVIVSGGTCQGLDEGDAIAEACSVFLAQPCRLVRYTPQYPHLHYSNYLQARVSISFAYACPVHIIAEASLDDLNQRLPEPLPMNRFRPNIVVSGCAPYAEDTWEAITVGTVRLQGTTQCIRCATTLVDQATGKLGKEPLRTLATYRQTPRGIVFGKNCILLTEGMVRRGDLLRVPEE